jgi:hypothetical protein
MLFNARHNARHGALAAALLAVWPMTTGSAAAQSAPASLVGAWSCNAADQNGGVKVTTIYLPNGDMTSSADGRNNTPNGTVEMHITGTGTWTYAGGNLTERLSHVDLNSVTVNGSPIPPGSDAWTSISNAASSAAMEPNVRQVTALDADSMSVEYQGNPLTCTRG